jgi:hypothetical protein
MNTEIKTAANRVCIGEHIQSVQHEKGIASFTAQGEKR